MRESKGIPKQVNIYDYLYDIDSEKLTLLVQDKGAANTDAKYLKGSIVRAQANGENPSSAAKPPV